MTPDQLAALLASMGYGAYVPLLLAYVGLCAKLAAILPQATSNSSRVWQIIRKIIDISGGNWGNASNASTNSPAPPPPT